MASYQSDGPLDVHQRMIIDGVCGIFFFGQTIFEYKCGDAMLAEPPGRTISFVVNPKFAMATSWSDDDCGSGCLFRCREIRGNGWMMNIRDNMIALLRHPDHFISGFTFRAGSTVGPKRNFFRLTSRT